jgi:predicted DNA-binding transcriptional regulator AlpA
MVHKYQAAPTVEIQGNQVQVIRHKQVCQKLQISSAKLFDMIAKKQFLKPFTLIPGGRAVGWIEQDVDRYILDRKNAQEAP